MADKKICDDVAPKHKPCGEAACSMAPDDERRHGRVLSQTVPAWWCRMGACLAWLLLPMLGACQAQDAPAKPPAPGKEVMLTMLAYNYTDHYIDNYFVDGIGGANVFVSGPDSGGGGGTCCVRWVVGGPLPVTVHVRWESGECLYTKNVDGQDFKRAKSFYTEKDVQLTQPPAADPKFFETHFFPDGHVEVAITDDYSPPRLKLPEKDGRRPGVKAWPRCTPEQMRRGED